MIIRQATAPNSGPSANDAPGLCRQAVTPPPARLDQRPNLSPCSPDGPYEFLAKRNQFHVVLATRLCRRAKKIGNGPHAQRKSLCNKKPGNCPGFSIFGDFILLDIASQIRGQNRLCDGREYLNLRLSLRYSPWMALSKDLASRSFSMKAEPLSQSLFRIIGCFGDKHLEASGQTRPRNLSSSWSLELCWSWRRRLSRS
jgi:hypothetical protein